MNINGANLGEYCFKDSNNEQIYQENVQLLKQAFGENSMFCNNNETSYIMEMVYN